MSHGGGQSPEGKVVEAFLDAWDPANWAIWQAITGVVNGGGGHH